MYKLEGQDDQEDGEPHHNNDDAYIQKYFSNDEGEKKPWSEDDESGSDSNGSPEVQYDNDEEGHHNKADNIKPKALSMNDLEEPEAVPAEKIDEVPEFYSNNYWKLEEH